MQSTRSAERCAGCRAQEAPPVSWPPAPSNWKHGPCPQQCFSLKTVRRNKRREGVVLHKPLAETRAVSSLVPKESPEMGSKGAGEAQGQQSAWKRGGRWTRVR